VILRSVYKMGSVRRLVRHLAYRHHSRVESKFAGIASAGGTPPASLKIGGRAAHDGLTPQDTRQPSPPAMPRRRRQDTRRAKSGGKQLKPASDQSTDEPLQGQFHGRAHEALC
jgi:hypothetical protein